jgi:transcriptional regulator with XRE-family HTH domain
MSESLKPVSETVKALREGRGLSQANLSKAIGFTPVYMYEIERGRKIPTDGEVFFKLAQFYKVPFTPLLKAAFNENYLRVRAKFPEDEQ